MPNLTQYKFRELPSGKVEIYDNNQPISKGVGFDKSYAAQLGYQAADVNAGQLPPLSSPDAGVLPSPEAPKPPSGAPGVAGATSATPPTTFSSMPLDIFGNAMNEIRTKLSANQDLMDQKAKLLKQVYDTPLTPAEMTNLTPSQQTAIMGNDRKMIDMEVRLVNDSIKGRKDTLDTSISYITDIYKTQQDATQKQFDDAQNIVKDFVGAYGSNAGDALKSLYGPEKIQQLKAMGIDIGAFAAAAVNLPTINEQRYIPESTGNFTVTIPEGTIASRTNNPLNIKFSQTMAGFGATNSGIVATDGGSFSAFNTPEEGLKAGISLLQTNYGSLTVEAAMRRWSNQSYGAEISSLDPHQLISSLSDSQMQQLTSSMAQRECGATIDYSAGSVDPNPPDPETANNVDPSTGRTASAIWNDAIQRAFEGTALQQFVGGLSSTDPKAKAIKNQIDNKSAAIVSAMGSSYPALKAMYKANASAATKFVTQALFVKTYMRTTTDNLDLALAQSAKIGRTGSKLANNYLQWSQGNLTPAGPLAEFETYIYTASREYAKVTSGGAMSAQGLTDSAQREAGKLLNAAQSPEAFAATAIAMKQDMANVIKELDTTVAGFSSTLGVVSPVSPSGGGTQNAPEGGTMNLQQAQDAINKALGF